MSVEEKAALINAMAQNLPILRAKLGISQEELAQLLSITRQTISSYENRQREMAWSMFLALILIFFRNEETKMLLVSLDIYTPALNNYLIINKD